MASETIQSDPGDECDATGCSCHRSRGLLALLSPEQLARALAYDGPENFGPEGAPRLSPAVQPEERKP